MQFKSKFVSSIAVLAITLSAISPSMALAKNTNKNKGNDEARNDIVREERMVKKAEKEVVKVNKQIETRSCAKAFGHLIAPGWIKKHGQIEIDTDCPLPFGIFKKLFNHNGNTGTTTPVDTTLPVISNIVVNTGNTFAVITWNTDERTDGKIFWSTTTPVSTSSSSTHVVEIGGKSFAHFALISGLTASTTYYAKVSAKDIAGNTSTSSEFSFATGGGTVIISDTTAPIISATSTEVGTSTMKVSWNTNEPATSKVYYGTTSPLSTFVSSSSLVTSHTLNLTNLATGSPYFLIVESSDSSGNKATSTEFSTTTLSL